MRSLRKPISLQWLHLRMWTTESRGGLVPSFLLSVSLRSSSCPRKNSHCTLLPCKERPPKKSVTYLYYLYLYRRAEQVAVWYCSMAQEWPGSNSLVWDHQQLHQAECRCWYTEWGAWDEGSVAVWRFQGLCWPFQAESHQPSTSFSWYHRE